MFCETSLLIHTLFTPQYFMRAALQEAQKALDEGEIPVGAVIVCEQTIIARAYNQVQRLNDVTAHAEMLAITAAADYLNSKYLPNCTLYVTLEPCVMCAGAIAWAQVGELVYGASDLKKGFAKLNQQVLHPKTKLIEGVMSGEAAELLKRFFQGLR